MPAGEVARRLLEQCADMVLRCDDGRCIPCSRFVVLKSCEVFRDLSEHVALESDDRGRWVVPAPGLDPADLEAAVAVMHGLIAVPDLDVATAGAAVRGMRAVGHSSHLVDECFDQLWNKVKRLAASDLVPHLDDLLRDHKLRWDVLARLKRLLPTWNEFAASVLDGLHMDRALASWLIACLADFFPAAALFSRVLARIPSTVLDANSALNLFTETDVASHLHPAEVGDVLHALSALFERSGWDATLLGFMRKMRVALDCYGTAPSIANSLGGSIVEVEDIPAVSVLLLVKERTRASRRIAPWLAVDVDYATGDVNACYVLAKLGVSRARKCQLRLTASGSAASNECQELWYEFDLHSPGLERWIDEHGKYVRGDIAGFRTLVRSKELTRLRLDLFYG